MWSVHVVASNNYRRQLKALVVGLYEHFGRCLARCIGVGWRKNARLDQIIVILLDFAVHLVCRYVYEALYLDFLGALQQHVGSIYICMSEAIRVAKTQVNVRLCGKVQDSVDFISLHAVQDFGWVCEVPVVESEIAFIIQNSGVVEC